MKAIILAGGFGTRLAEETSVRPKPMVEIGGLPIIWHIMNIYAEHNINEFIICLGYKSEYIKRFFIDYSQSMSDITIDLKNHSIEVLERRSENWKITLLDTGIDTMTGGRIQQAILSTNLDEPFCVTYGDGLADINISKKIEFHKNHGKLCTVTAVTPPGRFGVLDIEGDSVVGFREKIASDQYRINGGFFVMNPDVSQYITGPETVWEQEPMEKLAFDHELKAYQHDGFWQPMDTLRDKIRLQQLWDTGDAPWRVQK